MISGNCLCSALGDPNSDCPFHEVEGLKALLASTRKTIKMQVETIEKLQTETTRLLGIEFENEELNKELEVQLDVYHKVAEEKYRLEEENSVLRIQLEPCQEEIPKLRAEILRLDGCVRGPKVCDMLIRDLEQENARLITEKNKFDEECRTYMTLRDEAEDEVAKLRETLASLTAYVEGLDTPDQG